MNPSLTKALVKAQSEFPSIPNDAENPHFKNKFASLHTIMEKVLPVLNANGLALMQFPTALEGQPALRTKLVHAESGEYEEDTMLLVLAKNDPQSQGSALTYARRYAVLSALGLVADEDDDGATASKSRAVPETTVTKKNAEDGPPSHSLVGSINALITELAALRNVERKTVLDSLAAKPMTAEWQTSETSAIFAIDVLRAWAKKATA